MKHLIFIKAMMHALFRLHLDQIFYESLDKDGWIKLEKIECEKCHKVFIVRQTEAERVGMICFVIPPPKTKGE